MAPARSKAKRGGIENEHAQKGDERARAPQPHAKLVLVCVLFAGLFVHIGMLAGISVRPSAPTRLIANWWN